MLTQRSELAVALALAGFLASVYLLTYSGAPHNPDEWFYLAGANAAVTGDWAALQAHGRLFSLLLAPFYAISAVAPASQAGQAGFGAFQSASLAGSVVTAATASLLYAFLREFELSRSLRLATALLFGLATLAWPYSHYLFREPAAGLALLVAVYGVIRWTRAPAGWRSVVPLLGGGLAFACGVAIKGTLLAFAPFLLAVLAATAVRRLQPAFRRRTAPWAALAATVVIAATVVLLRLPAFARFVPAYALGVPDFAAFAALWISPGWGLLLFSPVLVLALVGAPPFARRAPEAAFLALGGSAFYVLASTTNPFWWGYWAFGPRQLVVLLPLLCLPIPFGLQWLRRRGRAGVAFAVVVVGLSVLVQLLGVLTPFNEYVRDVLFPAGLTGPALTWRWDAWPLAGLLSFLRSGRLDVAWLSGGQGGGVRWGIFVGVAVFTATAGAWLWILARASGVKDTPAPAAVRATPAQEPQLHHDAREKRAGSQAATWISVVICLAWAPVALLAVRGAWDDPRYGPELGFPAAAAIIRAEAGPDDLLVTDLWTEDLNLPAVAMLNYCRAGCPRALNIVREDLANSEADWQQGYASSLAGHPRAWLVLMRVAPGDPNSIVEQWLGQAGYQERCDWTGPQVRLCRYALDGPAGGAISGSATVSGVAFGAAEDARIRLSEAVVRRVTPGSAVLKGGEMLLVDLAWEAVGRPPADYVASLQLLGPGVAGPVVSADIPLGNGFRPASGWSAGEMVRDRRSLVVPADLAPGAYQLLLVLYDPVTGQRLAVDGEAAGGATTSADALTLMDFQVAQ